jgi:excisionase family DNA binding protein
MQRDDERRTYDVEEAARLLGIGRTAAYEAARDGEIAGVRVIRIGRRMLVPREALDRVLRGAAALT